MEGFLYLWGKSRITWFFLTRNPKNPDRVREREREMEREVKRERELYPKEEHTERTEQDTRIKRCQKHRSEVLKRTG